VTGGIIDNYAGSNFYCVTRAPPVAPACTAKELRSGLSGGTWFGMLGTTSGRCSTLKLQPVCSHPARRRTGPTSCNPGFIEVVDVETLRIPDYVGNSMFNTLGNLVVDPAAGLVVPDFEHGRALQLTGRAEVLLNSDDPIDATGGTHRFLVFHTDAWLQLAPPAAVKTELLDYSPFNPRWWRHEANHLPH
jgi:hypothetical protein